VKVNVASNEVNYIYGVSQMIINKKRITICVILGVVSFITTLTVFTTLNNNNKINVVDKNSKEFAIEQYLLKEESEGYYRSSESRFFCAVEILWEYDLTNTEKVVYASNQCMSVVLVDGDLRGESGGGHPPLFKMQYKNNNWIVVDGDNRTISPKEPITQDWVKVAEAKIPQNIKNRCFANNCFSTDGVIKKAAEFFKVKLPEYPLNLCNKNSDCTSDSICVINGDHSNQGPNTCVKKCNTNSDCGIAHTCRYQCVNGENGCPETAEKICIPDLLSPDVVKDPNRFIGFDDFEIHRRRAIAEAYPDFTVNYEDQPCFAGCSVKVVEDARDYYYAYITHASGLPIGVATCFKVDPMMRAYKIGEFPDMTDSYIGYKDVDPKTCKGIK